jgi:fibronectin type 3 domain-containing protein
VQSFFDDLDNGRLDEAYKCLTTYDKNSGSFKAPDDGTYRQFLENMNQTYRTGDQSFRVQFVNVSSVQPVTSLLGDNIRLVQWDSIHYQVGTLSVYRLNGSFYVTEIGEQWRIIV